MHSTGYQDMAFVNDTGKEYSPSLDAVALPKQINIATIYMTSLV